MKYEHLEVEIKDHVQWIWLNRPDASNAYSESMVIDLPKILLEANLNKNVRVVVIGSRGKNFCAGGDLKSMQAKSGMFAGEANELKERYMDGIQQIPLAISRVRKPVIMMIQGAAIGAGCDLVAMGDIRVATSSAEFAETFINVGLVPGDGGAWFLIRAVGHSKASEMFLTRKKYSAQEAKEMGLVHRLVSSDQLVREVTDLAQDLASAPPIAMQLTKKALQLAYESSLEAHLDIAAAFQGITQNSSDHQVAVSSLLDKTQPTFLNE